MVSGSTPMLATAQASIANNPSIVKVEKAANKAKDFADDVKEKLIEIFR